MVQYHVRINERCVLNRNRRFNHGPGLKYAEHSSLLLSQRSIVSVMALVMPAYAGVVYMRMVDSNRKEYTSLVMSKTKVAPIKCLSIPRLELHEAQVLTQLLRHAKDVFHLPRNSIFVWTDSTIVISWLTGNR